MSGWSIVARRLMIRLALAGMVLAVVITGLLLVVEYRRDLVRVGSQLDAIEHGYLGSVVENVWLEDIDRLDMLVTGMARLQFIAQAEVRDAKDRVLVSRGSPPIDRSLTRAFTLEREYGGQMVRLGELVVVADLDGLRERMIARGGSVFGASVALIMVLSSLLYLMVHREITGRLAAVAHHARRLGEEGPGGVTPMVERDSGRGDELTELVTAFNEMRARLETSYAAVQDRESRYRELFTSFPIALWEEDFSAVRAQILSLRGEVPDGAAHLAANPELVRELAGRVRILDLNDTAVTLHRARDREELLGRLPTIFTPASFDAFRRQLLAIWHGENELVLESEVRTLDGDVRQVLVRWFVPPTARSDLSRVIVTTEDITERKQSERALEITLEKLTEANGELERFAFVASHDLQEPVRSVVSFSQLLERRVGAIGLDDPDVTEYLGFLKAAGLRMQQQVAGLLDYSRADRSSRPFTAVDMGEATAEALGPLREAIQDARAHLTIEPLPTVLGDRPQLVDLMRHLVDNAIKFRRADVAPEVAVSAQRVDSHWRITVRDNGIGLDPAYAAEIFQVFRRLHGPGQYPGAGIGLATCRRIVQRHGGHIWLDPGTGPGAVFHFTLPATL